MTKPAGAVSHHEKEIAELRADRELAVEYLKAAMEALEDPEARGGRLLALRTVAEAYGGLGAVGAEAGQPRVSLQGVALRQSHPKNLACRPQGGRNAAFGERRWRLRVNRAVTLQGYPSFSGPFYLGLK